MATQQQRPQARQARPAAPPPAPANDSLEKVSLAIESAINECGIRSISKLPAFMQAIRMAQGIRAIREALTDEFVLATLMPLQGTALGFLTDKDKDGGYGLHVVRDCCIEAMMRGFNVVGNEFNIIAARFYGTKAGFERQVAEFPGLRNLQLQPGVPEMKGGDKGSVVPYSASWTLNDQKMVIHCQLTKDGLDMRIPVKVNAGMGADAVIGKATRKMLFRIYQRVNGSAYGASDGEIGDDAILTTGETAPAPPVLLKPKGALDQIVGAHNAQKERQAEPASAAASAPENEAPVSLTWPLVQAALGRADGDWLEEGRIAIIAEWTAEQMQLAYDWAIAFNDKTVDDSDVPERPAFTVLGRQPGED